MSAHLKSKDFWENCILVTRQLPWAHDITEIKYIEAHLLEIVDRSRVEKHNRKLQKRPAVESVRARALDDFVSVLVQCCLPIIGIDALLEGLDPSGPSRAKCPARLKSRTSSELGEARYTSPASNSIPEPDEQQLVDTTQTSANPQSAISPTQAPRHGRRFADFFLMGLPFGTVIEYARAPGVTCVITGPKSVRYQGEELALSALTLRLLRELEGKDWPSARGIEHWSFHGELLLKRWERFLSTTGANSPA